MTLRYRLILIYLIIESILLVFFCLIIFFQSEKHRQTESKYRLEQEAITASTIFLRKNEISPELLKLLDKNNLTALIDEEIIIFDDNLKVVYESGEDKLDFKVAYLAKVQENKTYFWNEGQRELFGIIINQNRRKYIVVSSAIDRYGLSKQENLAYLLIFGGFAILILSAFAAWFYVKKMLQPINKIISKIDTIKSSQLSLRLDEGKQKDEFEQLSIRFNQMLERLQKAFISQREFVSNASHELRTPLTSITGQIQVSLLANDKPKELKLMITSVLEDVQQLNKLSNTLLDLTSIEVDSQEKQLVNILDKILRVRNDILIKNPISIVNISFDETEEIIPELLGNAQLLFTAFLNLIENGIKYSPDYIVNVTILVDMNKISITFQNKSQLLTSNELHSILEPFVRGSNAKTTKGHGVGLSLTKKIVELHQGKIAIISSDSQGFLITLDLPKKI